MTEDVTRPLSVDARAEMIADAVAHIGEGNARERVRVAALAHIRAAIEQVKPGFYDGVVGDE